VIIIRAFLEAQPDIHIHDRTFKKFVRTPEWVKALDEATDGADKP